jgi:hypothetical protein
MPDEPKTKRTNSVIGKHARTKGRAYEQEIARALQELWPAAKRGIGQARSAGEVPDVTGTPYWIECKHKRKVSINGAYDQGVQASCTRTGPTTTTRPVLVISRENRTEDLVTMSLTEFKRLVKEANRAPYDDRGLSATASMRGDDW